MRNYIVTVIIVLCGLSGNAQTKKLVRLIWPVDSARSSIYMAMNGFGAWDNWNAKNRQILPVKQNYDVYYDYGFKHLGYSYRGKMNDTGWTPVSVRQYYVNGKVAVEYLYNARGERDSEIRFDYYGDTCYVAKKQGHFYTKQIHYVRSKWNPEKIYLAQKNLSNDPMGGDHFSIKFDENGDTTYYDTGNYTRKVRYTVQYADGRRISVFTQNGEDKGIEKKISYPMDQVYELKISNKKCSVLDSLEFYPNVKRIEINIDRRDSTGTGTMLAKLTEIPRLSKLESVQLIGRFISIPPPVFQCKNLLELTIHSSLIRIIPPDIKSLLLLRSLRVSANDSLNGNRSIKNIALLPNLRELHLRLEDGKPLSPDIALLTNLWYLSLGSHRGCSSPETPPINIQLLYKLKSLRSLEICWDEYCKVNPFEFAVKMPGCTFSGYETCFDEQSMVTLATGGEKLISDIRIGDVLLGYCQDSAKFCTTTVTALHQHHKPLMEGIKIVYHFASDSSAQRLNLTTTAIHPFWANGQWIIAAEIKSGDVLKFQTGNEAREAIVDELNWYSAISEDVYNFSTTNHTFFVNGVLVHNK